MFCLLTAVCVHEMRKLSRKLCYNVSVNLRRNLRSSLPSFSFPCYASMLTCSLMIVAYSCITTALLANRAKSTACVGVHRLDFTAIYCKCVFINQDYKVLIQYLYSFLCSNKDHRSPTLVLPGVTPCPAQFSVFFNALVQLIRLFTPLPGLEWACSKENIEMRRTGVLHVQYWEFVA